MTKRWLIICFPFFYVENECAYAYGKLNLNIPEKQKKNLNFHDNWNVKLYFSELTHLNQLKYILIFDPQALSTMYFKTTFIFVWDMQREFVMTLKEWAFQDGHWAVSLATDSIILRFLQNLSIIVGLCKGLL